jgi:hypothetical protein
VNQIPVKTNERHIQVRDTYKAVEVFTPGVAHALATWFLMPLSHWRGSPALPPTSLCECMDFALPLAPA